MKTAGDVKLANDLTAHVRRIVGDVVARGVQVEPVLLAMEMDEDGEVVQTVPMPVGEFFVRENSMKGTLFRLMEEMAKHVRIGAIALVTEAWIATRDGKTPAADLPDSLEDLPDRQEGVILTILTKTAQSVVMIPIDRATKSLGDARIHFTDDAFFSGRMIRENRERPN